jgi:hypothetical protein
MASGFVGALIFTLIAAFTQLPAFLWIAIALLLFAIAVNVPRNDAIKAAGLPDNPADLAQSGKRSTRPSGGSEPRARDRQLRRLREPDLDAGGTDALLR